MKAYIWRRSSSEIVHHGGRRVACRGLMAWASGVACGLRLHMTQKGGRGATAPTSTRRVCFGGRVSKYVTASLAAASARSLSRMWV